MACWRAMKYDFQKELVVSAIDKNHQMGRTRLTPLYPNTISRNTMPSIHTSLVAPASLLRIISGDAYPIEPNWPGTVHSTKSSSSGHSLDESKSAS